MKNLNSLLTYIETIRLAGQKHQAVCMAYEHNQKLFLNKIMHAVDIRYCMNMLLDVGSYVM